LTRHDFFQLAVERLVPQGVPDYWQEYRAGRLTHFEAMQRYYASIRASGAETRAVVEALELEPKLAEWIGRLGRAGWNVVVASAGCEWYIRYLLAKQGVALEVYANPGRFVEGKGLLMELPVDSRYFSPSHGIDKSAVVRAAQRLFEGMCGESASLCGFARFSLVLRLPFAFESLPLNRFCRHLAKDGCSRACWHSDCKTGVRSACYPVRGDFHGEQTPSFSGRRAGENPPRGDGFGRRGSRYPRPKIQVRVDRQEMGQSDHL